MNFANNASEQQINRCLAEATSTYTEAFDYWREEGDLEMMSLQLADLADCMQVIAKLQVGENERAVELLLGMDTAPREILFDILERHGVVE